MRRKKRKKKRKPKRCMEHCEMTNILRVEVLEKEEKGKGLESLFKVTVAENFLYLKRKWMEVYWTYKRT